MAFFKRLLADKRRELDGQVRRLDVGLSTLQKTAEQVAGLQEELKSTMVRVDERRTATEDLLEEMGRQRGEAEKQQEAASVEKEKASKAAEEASRIAAEAESELADAKPMMEAARNAVNCLDKASLTELKGFTKPPSGVDQVTTAVMMMVRNEKRDFSWDKAKKMMARVDAFKKSLEDYDAETIPEEVVARVDPILADKEFDAEKMQKKSVAAANLLLWVVNVISYHKVYKKVKPLMDSLEVARQEKQAAESELEKALAVVRNANEQLAKLQKDFLAATDAKAKVRAPLPAAAPAGRTRVTQGAHRPRARLTAPRRRWRRRRRRAVSGWTWRSAWSRGCLPRRNAGATRSAPSGSGRARWSATVFWPRPSSATLAPSTTGSDTLCGRRRGCRTWSRGRFRCARTCRPWTF